MAAPAARMINAFLKGRGEQSVRMESAITVALTAGTPVLKAENVCLASCIAMENAFVVEAAMSPVATKNQQQATGVMEAKI